MARSRALGMHELIVTFHNQLHLFLMYSAHLPSSFIPTAGYAGVPGEKPSVTSDKLPDSCSKFPCIQL